MAWTTVGERNSHYFAIERSHDGKNFVQIGKVDGQGTSNTAPLFFVYLEKEHLLLMRNKIIILRVIKLIFKGFYTEGGL